LLFFFLVDAVDDRSFALELSEALLKNFFVRVELLNPQFCSLGFFKVLVNVCCLRLAETDKVYNIGENLLQAWIGRAVEIRERKIVD
jgi:hypothetical protein